MNYADAGVSLARADEAMVGVKKSVRTTFNQGVLGDVGNFGGLFTLNHLGMKDPVLVSSVDGVGTKLKVDIEMGTHELPGQDIVNINQMSDTTSLILDALRNIDEKQNAR